jgi:hypothetical protein
MRSRGAAVIVCSRLLDHGRHGVSALAPSAWVDSVLRVNSQADGGISESQQLARAAQIGTLQRQPRLGKRAHAAVLPINAVLPLEIAGEPAFAAERTGSYALRQSGTGAGGTARVSA